MLPDLLSWLSVIRIESEVKSKICPGDFVFVSYDDVPIIEDMHCEEKFEDAVPDRERGGHNDWYIEAVTKYSKGGFMVKAKRRLRTRDSFDDVIKREPNKTLFGLHTSSYTLTKPEKTGIRSISKFQKYMD